MTSKTREIFKYENDFKKYDNIEDLFIPVKFYTHKKIQYGNVAMSFDIETSSFYYSEKLKNCKKELTKEEKEKSDYKKVGSMYMWGLGLNGRVMIQRTYKQFIETINQISKHYELDKDSKRLICYIHNASYEFQFIRKHFNITQMFAIDDRQPIYFVIEQGIEFRCSFLLSGYKLEKVGENLLKYKVKKLVGSLDYELIRHTKTKITDLEYDYLINDNLVVMSYIQEYIEKLGRITRIPYTKTGVVRRLCRNNCFYENNSHKVKSTDKWLNYQNYIHNMNIQSELEYNQLRRAFMGGFTHANSYHVNELCENVSSFDFTSSYPYCMCAFQYPCSTGFIVSPKTMDELENYLKNYCVIMDLDFYDIESKIEYEHYLSVSKCQIEGNSIEDNGRLVYAKRCLITLTNVDYEIVKKTYKWTKCKYKNIRCYYKNYLPKDLILTILQLYSDKTTLKGVEGKEIEYLSSKENVNSVYGMMVMSIVRELFKYDDLLGWYNQNENTIESLETYNKSKQRFLFYPWGVFITAYARRNLWTGIFNCKMDYIYSDTDSIKILNYEKHLDYINKYNEITINNLKSMCDFYKIDFKLCEPLTIKGVKKTLGVWDLETTNMKYFKTLGAKRYMTYYDDKLSFTISGVNKKCGIPYLLEKFNNNIESIFNYFDNNFYIPKDYTGKLTHTYIDDEIKITISDYQNIKCEIHELSYIHLEKVDFTLTLSNLFIDFLKTFREGKI